MTYIGIKN